MRGEGWLKYPIAETWRYCAPENADVKKARNLSTAGKIQSNEVR